jgi:RimJ/RimL family protein N-acetyltransferase
MTTDHGRNVPWADGERRGANVATPVLSEGGVILRAWVKGDVPALVDACQDADIARFTTIPSPYTAASARWLIESSAEGWRTGDAALFAVTAEGDDYAVGSMSFNGIDRRAGIAEVGYWTAPVARGRGWTARALRLLCEWGFAEIGLSRIQLLADTDNTASQRVAEKVGFVREGVLRSARLRRDEVRVDEIMYSLLPGDLPRSASGGTWRTSG